MLLLPDPLAVKFLCFCVQGRPMAMDPDGSGGEFHDKASASPAPCHLLELTVISAQDLFPATAHNIRAYATAWVYPDKKLSTRTDHAGHTNPTWNDKLVFRVDDAFFLSPTSAITIDIFATRRRLSPRLRDTHLGTVRVLLSALRPEPGARCFAALQVRRPSSLRPQGILNVAVALLDGLAYVDRMVPLHDNFGEPYAFSYNDLETLSLEPREGETSMWFRGGGGGGGEGGDECTVEKSGSVESWVGEKEQEALESKLESWKLELSPDCYEISDRSLGGRRKRRRRLRGAGSFRSLSCFCGGATRWA